MKEKVKEAKRRLQSAGHNQLKQIKVKRHNGSTIVLEGIVKSFYMKRLAQETVKIENVNIQNNLIVDEKGC